MEQKVARYCGDCNRGAGICGLCPATAVYYKAEALLLPPKAKDVQSLNVQGVQEREQGVQEREQGVTAEAGAFAAFKNNLSSRSLQKKFIDEQGLMDILAPNQTPETRDIEILENFSTMIIIEDKGVFYYLYRL